MTYDKLVSREEAERALLEVVRTTSKEQLVLGYECTGIVKMKHGDPGRLFQIVLENPLDGRYAVSVLIWTAYGTTQVKRAFSFDYTPLTDLEQIALEAGNAS